MALQDQILVQQAADAVTAAYNDYLASKKQYDDITLLVKEWQRQIDYHNANGNTSNAQWVNDNKLQPELARQATAKTKMDLAKQTYDIAVQNYQTLSTSLLTPAEQETSALQLSEQLQNVQTGTNPDLENAEAEARRKKTVRILVIGGIVIVVIIIGFFTIRFFIRRSKAAQ